MVFFPHQIRGADDDSSEPTRCAGSKPDTLTLGHLRGLPGPGVSLAWIFRGTSIEPLFFGGGSSQRAVSTPPPPRRRRPAHPRWSGRWKETTITHSTISMRLAAGHSSSVACAGRGGALSPACNTLRRSLRQPQSPPLPQSLRGFPSLPRPRCMGPSVHNVAGGIVPPPPLV